MKSFALAAAALVGLVASVSAQDAPTQSAPFHLKIKSANETLDGVGLSSCHAGAAIEALCVSPGPGVGEYYLNSTAGNSWLGWNLPLSTGNIPSSLKWSQHLSSNLAVPLFFPGDDRDLNAGFDEHEKLYLLDWYDETKAVAMQRPESQQTKYYNWHVCWTWAGGYWYQVLAWVTFGEPVNPTCVKVDVVREFVAPY